MLIKIKSGKEFQTYMFTHIRSEIEVFAPFKCEECGHVTSGSRFPVEVRLLGMVLLNAALFVISKMMMKKTGSNILEIINGVNTTQHRPAVQMKRPREVEIPI